MPASHIPEYTNVPEPGGKLQKYIIREQQNGRLKILILKGLYHHRIIRVFVSSPAPVVEVLRMCMPVFSHVTDQSPHTVWRFYQKKMAK